MEYSSVNLDERIFRLRNSYGDVKTFVGKVSVLLLLAGIGCWIYSYTEESTNFIVYGNILTTLFIPAILLYFGIDDVERASLNRLKRKYAKEVEKIKEARNKEFQNKMLNDVKTYTIGISLDYSSGRNLTEENRVLLDRMTFTKLKTVLNKICPEAVFDVVNGVALVSSYDFTKYDKVYSTILKTLSKIKKETDNTYALDMIVSTTTDAYNCKKDNVINSKHHLEIKGTSFRNRACTTSAFSKKYGNLKQSKYMGIPIGAYTLTNEDKDDFCELNIVYKDLSGVLANICN